MEDKLSKVKLELAKDILDCHHSIFYDINQRGTEILAILNSFKSDEIIPKEQLEKLKEVAYIMSEQNRFYKLGILSKNCAEALKIKKEIFNKL